MSPEGPRVWIVSGDHWPRAYLRAELIERGYDATGFVSVKDAVRRLIVARSQRPALLVVDLAGQLIDEKLRATLIGERLPILAIAGSAYADRDRPGLFVGVLRRPLTIGAIADAVERLMRGPRA